MKRFPIVLTATVAGLAPVLAFHVGSPHSTLPLARPSSASSSRHGASATNGSAPPSSSGGSTTTSRLSAQPPGAPIPLITTPRTAVGANEQYGYGQLSVRVTVRGTRIQSVQLSGLQTADQYSTQLAQQVVPTLNSEVLQAQSANINGVAGASYTSQAYAASLQSALDKLHQA